MRVIANQMMKVVKMIQKMKKIMMLIILRKNLIKN